MKALTVQSCLQPYLFERTLHISPGNGQLAVCNGHPHLLTRALKLTDCVSNVLQLTKAHHCGWLSGSGR